VSPQAHLSNAMRIEHPNVHFAGPKVSQVQTISAAERDILVRRARLFNRNVAVESSLGGCDERPGDDFNVRGPDWSHILTDWKLVRESGSARYWQRPGKAGRGCSATTGVCANNKAHDLLCVFSSNAAPFPGPENGRMCSTRTKFATYALLKHGGDFNAAAKMLSKEGYGSSKAAAW
jgi:hypothetical protein